MEGFGEVVWKHMREEVEELGAGNMKRVWSEVEMSAFEF